MFKKVNNLPYAHAIVNPLAGAGKTARKWPQIKELLESLKLDFGCTLTEAPEHAIEVARTMANKGCRFFISVGGDGTVNEVVNGLYQADCLGECIVGIICTGTGADYIRTLGIPKDYRHACNLLINPKTELVDIGVVEYQSQRGEISRLFVNFAGLGFDAEVVKATNRTFKAMGSTLSYLMALLFTLFSYRNIGLSLKIDGEVQHRKIVTMIMGQGKYAGGGMKTTPDASPSDGFFDVLMVDDMSKFDLLWSLPRIYSGTHLTHPKVSVRRMSEVEVYTEGKVHIQVDGDLIGDTPARFYVLPAALNIII